MAQFDGSITVANEYTLIGAGSVYGRLTAGVAAIEIKIGASKLSGRTTVTIQAHPDNAGYVYIGLDNAVSATNYFAVLAGGSPISIKLDSIDLLSIWVLGSQAAQYIGVIEGKSS